MASLGGWGLIALAESGGIAKKRNPSGKFYTLAAILFMLAQVSQQWLERCLSRRL